MARWSMKKSAFVCALATCMILLSATQDAQSARLGLHTTTEEVEIWKQRAFKGPYKSKGDFQTNSPDDYDRTARKALSFLSNNAIDRWNGYTGTGCVKVDSSVEPAGKGEAIAAAGFLYLLQGNPDKYAKPVIRALLEQTQIRGADFSDTTRWCRGAQGVGDLPPAFGLAEYVTKLLFAYDYVKSVATPTERARLDKWFTDAARYFQAQIDYDMGRLFVNNNTGGALTADTLSNMAASGRSELYVKYTHHGGYEIPAIARWYNNRRGSMVRYVGLAGVMFNNESLKTTAANFFKGWLKYGVFPDGTQNEFYRNEPSKTEKGWNYALMTVSHMIAVADALARTGDNSLYEYTTSEGLGATKGGNKNLELVMLNFTKYLDGTFKRYFPGHPNDPNYLMDGIDPRLGWHYVSDIWFAQANVYYKNKTLTDTYLRKRPGNRPYPVNPQATGMYQPWGSPFAVYPGILFLFGQMEGRVWPYDGTQSPDEQSVSEFILVNADTEKDIMPLTDGMILNLAQLPTKNFTVRAVTDPMMVGSVKFGYDGNTDYRVEDRAPYAIADNTPTSYEPWLPSLGSHTLTATPYTQTGAEGAAGNPLTVKFSVVNDTDPEGNLTISKLMLTNSDATQDILQITNGSVLNLANLSLSNINIAATTSPATIGSVKFELNGTQRVHTESHAPYTLFGDGMDRDPWTLAAGLHTLKVTPYNLPDALGTAGNAITIKFEAVPSGATPIKVKASGKAYAGKQAHFRVFVDKVLIGEAEATDESKVHTFYAKTPPSEVTNVTVHFDNDKATDDVNRNEEPRELLLEYIQVGSASPMFPTTDGVTYDLYSLDGNNVQDGVSRMQWNGFMIFPIKDVF